MRRLSILAAALLLGAVAAEMSAGRRASEAGNGPAYRYTNVGFIGKAGDGPGAFARGNSGGPAGVAVDQRCGDIYVSDRSKRRVQRLDQHGRFLNYVGEKNVADPLAEGEFNEPLGLDFYVASVPENVNGPPRPCGTITTLTPFLWVADLTGNRVSIFEPDGKWVRSWCYWDLNTQGCEFFDDRIDFYPHDVDVVGDRVYIAGISSDTAREYNRAGDLLRKTQSVNGAHSVSVWGGQLWLTQRSDSKIGLFSLDPGNTTINRYHELGSTFDYTGRRRGHFTYPRALTTAPNGTLYVLDGYRVQVFSPSGRYWSEFALPKDDTYPQDLAVRYDGTVYVAVVRHTGKPGVMVFSPGPLVSLKLRQKGRKKIRISGAVKPGHAGSKIELQRLDTGWRTIRKVRLDSSSRFSFDWNAPRAEVTYTIRAFFKDPHRYHADRASQIKDIKLR